MKIWRMTNYVVFLQMKTEGPVNRELVVPRGSSITIIYFINK